MPSKQLSALVQLGRDARRLCVTGQCTAFIVLVKKATVTNYLHGSGLTLICSLYYPEPTSREENYREAQLAA